MLLYEGLNAHGVKYARDASTAAAQGRVRPSTIYSIPENCSRAGWATATI